MGLTPDVSPRSPRAVRLYLAIVSDPEGRAALNTLRKSYETRIWYLGLLEHGLEDRLQLLVGERTDHHAVVDEPQSPVSEQPTESVGSRGFLLALTAV